MQRIVNSTAARTAGLVVDVVALQTHDLFARLETAHAHGALVCLAQAVHLPMYVRDAAAVGIHLCI